MARAILELIADPASLLKGLHKSSEAAEKFGKDLKGLQVTAEKTANAEIQAAVRKDARLRNEIAVYRQVASAAKHGSREQVAAANLATRSEERLARSLAVTSREAKSHARSLAISEKGILQFSRGAIAGSGAAKSLGRSLAFASGGFLATASLTAILRASIEQGSKAAAVQKQLAAQFRQSGQDLGRYQAQIDDTIASVSKLAGFEDDDLTRAFTTAFRATRNVNQALTITKVSADAARGAHKDLASITLGLTRAWGGAATSLRRLGILIPKTAKGMEAIRFVAARFKGQAEAGTTAQDRFRAALVNTEQTIGLVLLPTFNRLLGTLTDWLGKEENQKKIAHDLNATLRVTGDTLRGLAGAFHVVAVGLSPLIKGFRSLVSIGRQIHGVFMSANNAIRNAANFAGGPVGIHFGGGPGGIAPSSRSGQSTFDRQAGRSSGGAGAFLPAVAGPTPPGSLGFKARFATVELALARAQLTKAQADDRKILKLEAALLRERIKTLGTSRKTLADRTALTVQLVSIEGQITSIDQDAASKVTDARKKRLTAEQKAAREAFRLQQLALRNQAQRLAAEKSTATKELSALKQRETALSSKIKQIQSSFRSALDTARQGIGDLFGGPVLNFSDEQRKAALGIPNSAADPKTLVRDLNAQVKQAAAFQRNLGRLGKRGAPAELIKELQSGGLANATEVQALTGASKGTLKEFFKAFGTREKLVQNIAHAQMRAQLVTLHADRVRLTAVRGQEIKVEVEIKGIAKDQAKVKVKQSAAQRRGPVPGRGD